jgi:hypothetical protein
MRYRCNIPVKLGERMHGTYALKMGLMMIASGGAAKEYDIEPGN